jgi:hypothetical protein
MIEEELTRVITKIDSCIHLMQNGKFIHAYEKINGIRQIVINIILDNREKEKINNNKENV